MSRHTDVCFDALLLAAAEIVLLSLCRVGDDDGDGGDGGVGNDDDVHAIAEARRSRR